MSNSLVQEKLAYFHHRSQYVVFNNEGYVKDSCQTLFEIPSAVSIYEHITFMEAMQDPFTQLSPGEDINFLCINTTLMGREGYYNFYIKRQSKNVLKWFIYDLTEFYSYLQPWQQERNDQAIASEHLRLQQRAARLEKQLLQYQNEELQRIEQMKTAFFFQVSHEMRTPLNSIVGLSHLLAKEASPSQIDSVRALTATAQHLATIVDDVLDWAKLENDTIEIHPASFLIKPLVQNVVEAFRPECQKKGVSLLVYLNDAVPDCLVGDATRLSQILYNLLGNAVKFTSRGEIRLLVENQDETTPSKEDDINQEVAHLRFSISDTGIGMTEEEKKRITNPYVQANDQIHRNYGGTGLGLSIVQKLIERLNGSWNITSQPEKGTTVAIDLLLPVGDKQDIQLASGLPNFSYIQTILVAEDDLINQKVISQLLTQWGLEPTVVENGRLALEQLRTSTFDLLILDYQMPEIDGAEVLRIMQKEQLVVPTIVLSGNAHAIALPENAEQTILILNKPILPPVLQENIKQLDCPTSFYIIDLHYLRQITNNQTELLIDLMDTFVQQAPLAVKKIRQAWEDNNTALLNRTVHKAKPSFQYIGAAKAEQLLVQLDNCAEEPEQMDSCGSVIQQLEKLTQQTIAQLKQSREQILAQ